MTRPSTTSLPSILVDTNIVSGLVKRDLPPAEIRAVESIVEMMVKSAVTMAGSTVMRDELSKIPAPARAPHDAIANTLTTLKTSSGVTWIDPNTGAVQTSKVYMGLCRILPDEPDARMIAIGVEYSQEYFMTCDERSVLDRRGKVEAAYPIKLRRPTEILGALESRIDVNA